jgi:hypothetical protein
VQAPHAVRREQGSVAGPASTGGGIPASTGETVEQSRGCQMKPAPQEPPTGPEAVEVTHCPVALHQPQLLTGVHPAQDV